jgi:hypothetical protein
LSQVEVHLFDDDGEVAVWLDTGVTVQDGLCIGLGATRPLAINDALQTLREAVKTLDKAAYDGGARIAVTDLTDDERLTAIFQRYHGHMDTLELTPDARAQLALDLGVLCGMCTRLLHARQGAR